MHDGSLMLNLERDTSTELDLDDFSMGVPSASLFTPPSPRPAFPPPTWKIQKTATGTVRTLAGRAGSTARAQVLRLRFPLAFHMANEAIFVATGAQPTASKWHPVNIPIQPLQWTNMGGAPTKCLSMGQSPNR